MKKAYKNNILIAAIVLIAVMLAVCLIRAGFTDSMPKADADSNFAASDAYFYYNDVKGDIYRIRIETKDCKMFAKGLKLLSVKGDEVLALQGTSVVLLNEEEGIIKNMGDFNTLSAYMTDEYLYYTDESKRLCRMDIATNEHETVPMMENIEVDKFIVQQNGDIFFTADTNRIVRYNPSTLIMATYADEKKPVDFSVDDGYIVYSDANDRYKVYMKSLSGGDETLIRKVKTEKLVYKNGRIFYIDNAGKSRNKYKIRINEQNVHK